MNRYSTISLFPLYRLYAAYTVDGGQILVSQGDREQRRRGGTPRQHGHIEVRQGRKHPVDLVAVDAQVADNLAVGILLGDRRGPRKIAQERNVRHYRPKVGHQPGNRQGDATPLARPGDSHPVGPCHRVLTGYLDGQHRVCVDPAVVIRGGVQDPSRHETRMGRPGTRGVRRVARAPGGPLAPRVHRQASVPGQWPRADLVGETSATAVAQVPDDHRQGPAGASGQVQPSADRVAAEARKGHVVSVYEGEPGLDRLEHGWFGGVPALGDGSGPEGVQVRGHGKVRGVADKLVPRQFVEGHDFLH